jgi:hypothetical protein
MKEINCTMTDKQIEELLALYDGLNSHKRLYCFKACKVFGFIYNTIKVEINGNKVTMRKI